MATLYLSSTYIDLVDYRQAVCDALDCMEGYHVSAMEQYGAMDQRPLDKCLKDVADCDLYIGLFAWRYGFVPPEGNPEGKSITELEYRHAVKTGKSCLLFLLHEDAPWLPRLMDVKTGEGDGGTMIHALREELEQRFMVGYFSNPQELAERVSKAVDHWQRERPGQGPLPVQHLLRQHYLKKILHRYDAVRLPIMPQEGFSLRAIFQPLTLLRDPRAPEDLEQERRRSLLGEQLKETEDDPFMQGRANELRREEEMGSPQQEVTATDSEDALRKSPQRRLVILGGPGTGKTTTLQYLVSRRAEAALADLQAPVPVFFSLADFARKDLSLKSYLTVIVDDLEVELSYAGVLWNEIEAGNAFLCLDSLDEVEPSRRPKMIDLLNSKAADGSNTWIIGSRFTEYKGGQFKQGQFAEWELQKMNHDFRLKLAQHLFTQLQALPKLSHQNSLAAETFVGRLERHSQAVAWGENPLLFSLAAIVFAQKGELPASRAMLYRKVLDAVLTTREPNPLRSRSLHRMLTELALWLHQTKGRTFTSDDLLSFFADVRRQSWGAAEDLIQRLINSGVLDIVSQWTYGFRHMTFQEYFAAAELSKNLTCGDRVKYDAAWNFILNKHTRSRWTEVLRLMTGILIQDHHKKGAKVVYRWLHELAYQRTTPEGDPGLLGLILAVTSLNELASLPEWQTEQTLQLEREIVAAWIEEVLQAARHQQRTKRLRLVAHVREISTLRPQTLQHVQERLVLALHDIYAGVRTAVAHILGYLGDYAPIDALIATALHDEDWYVYRAANQALRRLGERVPLDPLLTALQNQDKKIRSAAARALGALGERAPLDALLIALQDKEEIVRSAAAGALGQLGERAPLDALLIALQDKEAIVRGAAAEALGQLGERAPLDPLLEALQDKEETVRSATARGLGQLGKYAPLEPLFLALQDESWSVRRYTAEALGQLGERVPLEPLLSIALKDGHPEVRRYAVEALGGLRKHIPQHILFVLLQDANERIRAEAAKAIGLLKKHISFDSSVLLALQKESQLVRRAAAEILGHLVEQVSLEPLLPALQDSNWLVRRATVEIIGLLGYLGCWVPLEPFLIALRDDDWSVRYTAAKALSEFGERVPLDPLLAALRDDNWRVRRMAARALGQIKEQVSPISLLPALQDSHWEVRYYALDNLGKPGNLGECVPLDSVVTIALSDKDRAVRFAAAEVLQRLKDRVPLDALLLALQNEDKKVRSAAATALGHLEEYAPIEPLLMALQDEEWNVRGEAAVALGLLGERALLDSLLRLLQDDEEYVRSAAAFALGRLEKRAPIEPLVQALQDKGGIVRFNAARALGKLRERAPIEPLLTTLQDKETDVRREAARSLGKLGEGVPVEPLLIALQDEERYVRDEAARSLGRLGLRVPLNPLLIALQDKYSPVRSSVVQALELSGARVPTDIFITMLSDEAPSVRIAALDALKHIAPERLDEVKVEAKDVLLGHPPGKIFASLQQGFIADVLGGIGGASPEILEQLDQLLYWPHWQVRVKAAQALGNIRRSIPDKTIHRLLELRREPDPTMRAVREAADDALAEILSLETGIEDD